MAQLAETPGPAVRSPLSGIVIARDEEERLAACLASLRPHCAELLVVLDSRHSPQTRRVAEAAGARTQVTCVVGAAVIALSPRLKTAFWCSSGTSVFAYGGA